MMKRTRGIMTRVAGTAPFLLLLLSASCMETELASTWLDRPIVVDGRATEWAGREAYYDQEEGLKVGFFNDDRLLYIYFASWRRPSQMQILRNGLTVWLDESGGKIEAFGIEYPVGGMRPEFSGKPGGPGDVPPELPSSLPEFGQRIVAMLDEARGQLRVVGPGGEVMLAESPADSGGSTIEAMIDYTNRTLIYELRVPLASAGDSPSALHAAPGRTIGVGFKVGKMRTPEGMPDGADMPPGGGPGGGGFPGGGGLPGGGMGGGMGRGGGMPGRSVEPLEIWFKVKLAAKPNDAGSQASARKE